MAQAPREGLIGGRYVVELSRPMAGAGGGLPAFAASDPHDPQAALVAIQAPPAQPPPLRQLAALGQVRDRESLAGMLAPLAHGAAPAPGEQEGYFIICPAPPGPALQLGRAWGEAELSTLLLAPVAAMLDRLQALGLTHRALRPENLFHGGAGAAVVAGCGWAAPPAALQPALYEPPYMAMCLPAGRGAGSIADDVYALGVLLVVLAAGRDPLAGLSEAQVIARKLELGSYDALTAGARLPPGVVELVRGMLAEDPDHRPPPALLMDPAAARGRRLASRPARRATRAIEIGGLEVWNTRMLAYAIGRQPDAGAQALRAGEVDQWLRRALGDVGMAARVDEAAQPRARGEGTAAPASAQGQGGGAEARFDPHAALRAVVAADPLAPLCWRGIALWPDGLGPALAEAQIIASPALRQLEELVAQEVVPAWAEQRAERCDVSQLRQEARVQKAWLRQRGAAGGLPRLCYGLSPLMPCGSPLLTGRWVAGLAELLVALEAAAGRAELRRGPPVDRHVTAFIAARADQRLESETAEDGSPVASAMLPLRLLARLQDRLRAGPLPALGQWLAQTGVMALDLWHGATRRSQIEQKLGELARQGDLMAMLQLLDDARALEADRHGEQMAIAEVQRIDVQLSRMAATRVDNAETARRLGQEVCVALGLLTLVAAVGLSVL